jgi:hypothetical protein
VPRRSPLLAFAFASSLLTAPAWAVRSAPQGDASRLAAAPGVAPLRGETSATWGAPPAERARAFHRFLRAAGGRWHALWDRHTSAPVRVFGSGVPAPGSVADEAAAEAHARAFLAAHRDLLAPHAPVDQLLLAADVVHDGLRTVAFTQHALIAERGLVPVVGGRLNFRYRRDRLIVIGAETYAVTRLPAPRLDGAAAALAASAWIAEEHVSASLREEPALVALPLVGSGRVEVRAAYRVVLDAAGPRRRWAVYVDAERGTPLAREDLLRFDHAQVLFDAPVRAPQLDRKTWPAPALSLLLDGAKASTDAAGALTWAGTGAPASAELDADGPLVIVRNQAGTDAAATLSATDGADLTWSLADDEYGDAQLASFIHGGLIKEHARSFAPTMGFLDQQLEVHPNEDDPVGCNAYWDGYALNFYRQKGACNNTARCADVVYHEFGHGFHQHAIVPGAGDLDGALGEAAGDTMATSYTHDPRLSPGFFTGGDKELRNVSDLRRWPQDISQDPHETGLIWAGAMWDLREDLVAQLGDAAGNAVTDELYYAALRTSPNIPATYAEILAADDDDGDLANGTPHICAINRAFLRHGLLPFADQSGTTLAHTPLTVVPPGQGPYPIEVTAEKLYPQCPGSAIDAVTFSFRLLGGSPGIGTMTPTAGGFTGALPFDADGSAVRYSISASVDGNTTTMPANLADAEYRVFVGDVAPIYCNDFEEQIDGWVFQDKKGTKGDFGWGSPLGAGGDPAAAFSGAKEIGNQLGADGLYKNNRAPTATSPVVDVLGEPHVRVQFRRWLTVQDGAADLATVYVNDQPVWHNATSDAGQAPLDHRDAEWRFEDLDVSSYASSAGTIQVRFELAADGSTQLGGWNVDDFCVVAWHPRAATSDAGAGDGGDAGAADAGDPGTPDPASGCACAVPASRPGGSRALLAALLTGTALLRRGRRRPRPRSTG